MDISLHPEVVRRFPDLIVGFAFVGKLSGYGTNEEKIEAEKRIINKTSDKFKNLSDLESNYLNNLYRSFYKSLGIDPKKVSTPIKQARRVIENKAYRSIYKIIDLCMEIEYTTLISFQIYDFDKVKGDLEYRISDGTEVIRTFHNENKICKKGELILIDAESPLHSVYYGNNVDKSIDTSTSKNIVRIMGVPGIVKSNFSAAIEEFIALTGNKISFISKDHPVINLG